MKNNMYFYENKYFIKGFKNIVGLDEAGRGCWAGPLVVAACILPLRYKNDEINDSKTLSIAKREKLFDVIVSKAIDYKIVFIDAPQIDKLNPKGATVFAMKKALKGLKIKPDMALIDFEKIEPENSNQKIKSITKGDSKSISIAAASILAKVARDRYMIEINSKYPEYNFKKHKGYGTLEHLKCINKYGPIKNFHRFSFKPIKKLINK